MHTRVITFKPNINNTALCDFFFFLYLPINCDISILHLPLHVVRVSHLGYRYHNERPGTFDTRILRMLPVQQINPHHWCVLVNKSALIEPVSTHASNWT